MPEVAIVITGEPIEPVRARRGGFDALIREAVGESCAEFVSIDARAGLPSLVDARAVIVTGSAASVTDRAPWTISAEARVAEAVRAGVPVLGICFGHQMLGQALGGHVSRNPNGREIGSVLVDVTADDPLLGELGSPFLAQMTHVDAVVRLPPGAQVVARTRLDGNAAVRFGEKSWGVQFHPEMDEDVVRAYVEGRSDAIHEEGLDLAAIRATVAPTPAARSVLRRFLSLSLETGR